MISALQKSRVFSKLILLSSFGSGFLVAQSNSNDFAGVPSLPGTRGIKPIGAAPFEYVVEEGDTLYDICDQLLDDPDYWPKLWALNPFIRNPHVIDPGTRVRFFPGDGDTPPFLQVVVDDEIVPVDKEKLATETLLVQNAIDVIEKNQQDPPLEFEDAVSSGTSILADDPDFESFGDVFSTDRAKMVLPAFISPEEIQELGRVHTGILGETQLGVGETFATKDSANLEAGSLYSVIRPTGEASSASGVNLGYRYEFVGQIRILENFADTGQAKASVVMARLGVSKNDLIVPYRSVVRGYSMRTPSTPRTNPDARILGFEFPLKNSAGQGEFVLIDKELDAGTLYAVYQQMDERFPFKTGEEMPGIRERVGVIQILESRDGTSSGIIMSSRFDLRRGDYLDRG